MSQPLNENDVEVGRIEIVKRIDSETGKFYIGTHYSDDLVLADAIQMVAWANQFVVSDYQSGDEDAQA